MRGGIDTYDLPLQAGVWVNGPGIGREIVLVSGTSPVDFEFFDRDGRSLGIARDVKIGDSGGPGEDYYSLKVRSAVAQDIQYYATAGSFRIARIAGEVDATPVPAENFVNPPAVAVAGVSCVIVLAARPKRQKLSVHLPGSHPATCWLKGAAGLFADGEIGIPIAPGETHVVDFYAGEMKLHNPHANPVNVIVTEFF